MEPSEWLIEDHPRELSRIIAGRYGELHAPTGLDCHPFITVMCESLATQKKYVTKHPSFFEEDHHFVWEDYDLDFLADFIAVVADRWLMTPTPEPAKQLPR